MSKISDVPVIKVYDVDYSFIIKNYLNKELWKQTWTIFEYKDWVLTIKLDTIDVQDDTIHFFLILKDNSIDRCMNMRGTTFRYSFRESIDTLIKRINRTSVDLMVKLECEEYIKKSDIYSSTVKYLEIKCERLQEIASNFLDELNITNEAVRESYIERYVDDNDEYYSTLSEIESEQRYMFLTELFLMFAKVTHDDSLYDDVLKKTQNKDNVDDIIEEINESMEYIESDEFIDEMKDKLEVI